MASSCAVRLCAVPVRAENIQILPNKRAKLLDYGFGRCLPYQLRFELPTNLSFRVQARGRTGMPAVPSSGELA